MTISFDFSSLTFWMRVQVCWRIIRGKPFELTNMRGDVPPERDPSQLQ